jgi:hypothetical protein
MFMLEMSMDPRIRIALGIVLAAIGIVLHQVVVAAAGGIFLLLAGGQWLQRRRGPR